MSDPRPLRIGRRQLLAGAGAAAVVAGVGGARPAHASGRGRGRRGALHHALPAPSPIGATVPVGLDPPLDEIHWLLPGPPGATTQILGLEAMGLDVDPSTVGDFRGFSAYAVVAGQARGSDGNTYDVEFDVRVMEGNYRAADGTHRSGAFAFL